MADYFEGWYFKHQKDGNTLSLIPGKSNDGAFLQVITGENSYHLNYDLDAYCRDRVLQLGNSRFALNRVKLDIQRPDFTLTGVLAYSDVTPLEWDIMGPFVFLPMQCRHAVLSMQHRITGSVRLNGKDLDFTDGTGYIEADSGRAFPKSYTWLQCSSVDDECSVMVSVAHIPFVGMWFWGSIAAICFKGQQYRLATYCGARIAECTANRIELVQGDSQLIVEVQGCEGYNLYAPDCGGMTKSIRECPAVKAEITFRVGERTIFDWVCNKASFEHVQ